METTYRGYRVREDTYDKAIVGELGTYEEFINRIRPGDVCLDIGANIGVVSKAMCERGASKVISVEPDAENFTLLQHNSPDSVHHLLAVTGAEEPGDVVLYKTNGTNYGLHSTQPIRNREGVTVPGHPFAMLMAAYQPTVLKIDVEGAEYMFFDVEQLATVRVFAIELHFGRKDWREVQAPRIHEQLQAAGFTTIVEPGLTRNLRASMGIYERISG